MKSLIPFITLSIILLFNTSCEDFNEIVLDRTQVLESIEVDFEPVNSYIYNEKERISRINTYSQFSSSLIYYSIYEHGKDTIIVNLINNSNEITIRSQKIYHVDRKTVRRDIYGVNGAELLEYRLYRYNGNSCGYSEIEIYDPNSVLTLRTTYAYYNINCSQDIHNYNANDSLLSRIRIERDEKQPYFASTVLDIFKQGNVGNITEYTYMDADSMVNQDLSYYIDYQYNNFDNGNYPIVENKYYRNGDFEDRKFIYVGVQ